jgi:4-oxalocrotonate tautomerase
MPDDVADYPEGDIMPVMQIHITRGCHAPAKIEALLVRCSEHFASVLECPVERIRVFAIEHPADRTCIGGKLVSDGGSAAPYFSFVLMQGRSTEMKHKLMSGFTDLIEELLEVPRSVIRGGIVPVAPEDWSIAGVPASDVRKDEIRARSEAASGGNNA